MKRPHLLEVSRGAGSFGALIALANKRFKVWEDPRIDGVSDLLPGSNCGACGVRCGGGPPQPPPSFRSAGPPSVGPGWSFAARNVEVGSRFQSAASLPVSTPFGARPHEKPGTSGGRGAPPPLPNWTASRSIWITASQRRC